MATFDSWDSYFYPETYDPSIGVGTLRNLFDERDPGTLRVLEYGLVVDRQRELKRGDVTIAQTFDAGHLKAIHRHLFQDVYEWAGEYRTVDMSKGMTSFADVGTGAIDRRIADAHAAIERVDWSTLDHRSFAENASVVFAE